MALTNGTRINSYEIVSPLGEGGMGVVFRARDTKLGREVAIKVLPDLFSKDPDRLSRFQREAQVLASLNHPNIAHLYGLEEANDTRCIVMELVDGETLHERLKRGPIPADEALSIARQIAQALEAAHERGIIHRDLKPANVMLTREDSVKVLDFGLATIDQPSAATTDFSNSPTVFSASGGQVLMGTAAYMSPEQARGKAVDRRCDVWAFGCVLYEMLTGRQLFGGETVSDSIAKVLERAPDWNDLPNVDPRIRALLRRCLQKNLTRRMRDIGDVLLELDEIGEDASSPELRSLDVSPRRAARMWVVATLVFVAISIVFAGLYLRSRTASTEAIQLSIVPPTGTTFPSNDQTATEALSPDGRYVAFPANGEGGRKLWIRSLYNATAHVIEGSDGAAAPFWSPDSRWVGFFAKAKLYRTQVAGGKPEIICPLETASSTRASAAWNRDGTIVFGLDNGRALSRVSAEGGPVSAATQLDPSREDGAHLRPQFLPDGKHFLFLVVSRNTAKSGLYAGSLDSGGAKPVLLGVTTAAYYVPSGQILFVRNATLFAQNFDLTRLELRDKSIHLVDSIFVSPGNEFTSFSVSETGVLVYRTGGVNQSVQTQLTWFDRRGNRLETVGSIGLNHNPRLSPDGTRVAVQIQNSAEPGSGSAVWVLGPGTTSSRIADDAAFPVWTSDGMQLTYVGIRNGKPEVFEKTVPADGGEQKVLDVSTFNGHIDDVSPDGKYLIGSTNAGQTNRDVLAVPLAGNKEKPIPIAATPAQELFGRISPDGHWIAYASDESGTVEIYGQAFPHAASKILISRNGGQWPVWRRDGKEMFYISLDRKKLMAVSISGTATIESGTPQPLFDIQITSNSGGIGTPSQYDVSLGGQRFLINTATGEGPEVSPIHIILNWTELLKR